MKVMFSGHRQLHDRKAVKEWLDRICAGLIASGADTFYLGGYGEFDSLCLEVLLQLKQTAPHIKLFLILPYPDKSVFRPERYDELIYPPLENVPPRFAISKRNEWMVRVCDIVVTYTMYRWGGAAATLKYAQRQQKRILSFDHQDCEALLL